MKQSLQLRLGQQLAMTPQLQQAIRMLQLSTLELQMEVQQALDSNLMLETAEEDEGGEETLREGDQEINSDAKEISNTKEDGDLGDDMSTEAIPDELAVDSGWDDIYEPSTLVSSSTSSAGSERDFDFGNTTSESLRGHLAWQMQMSQLSALDKTIAEAIIDAIDEDGFLTASLEDIHGGLLQGNPEIELDEVEAVLHTIQNFDPVGVAARDLRESLLLQLKACDPDIPWLNEAQIVLQNHFEYLARRDYAQIKRRMKITDDELINVLKLIQSLNPRPGGHICDSSPQYIIPDIYVSKVKGRWLVELNTDSLPRLRINNQYASLIKQVRSSSDSATMKSHLQEARWFLKSLQSRNDTLLRVATSIVEHQRDFLEQGEVGMKPMVLHDIAEELEMHESTISRTTTRKYMHTPRGIFELKYFFSSHVGTTSGGECSSTAIRALIKQLIGDEQISKPLSDNKIAVLLSEQGINVARRTVAKYRESMAIPPSNERKRLA
jgi:RNA polymerase sigma-54 factor